MVLTFAATIAHIVMAGENVVVKSTSNTRTIPLYDVFEISFQHEGKYANPFFDVTVDVTFTAPSGRKIPVGGFHYGSSAGPEILVRTNQDARGPRRQTEYHFARQDLWKARFAPGETGRWTYAFVFTNTSGGRASGSGSFDCVKGSAPLHGFVRANPSNPFLWVFEDGTPYFPIGLQECINDSAGVGSVLAAQSLEGPFRLDRLILTSIPSRRVGNARSCPASRSTRRTGIPASAPTFLRQRHRGARAELEAIQQTGHRGRTRQHRQQGTTPDTRHRRRVGHRLLDPDGHPAAACAPCRHSSRRARDRGPPCAQPR
jgi:hypothetical protein